jgi:hypothetical protein
MVRQFRAPASGSLPLLRAGLGGLLILALLSPLAGQHRSNPPRGPRALAVLEVPAKGPPRLVPICIDIDGHFYDAGLYRATPRPLSLDPGTVYEAERTGDSVGLFTVAGASEINGAWVGYGNWRPHNATAGNAPQTQKASPKHQSSEEDERPVLRRPASQSTPPSSPSTESPAPGQSQEQSTAQTPDQSKPEQSKTDANSPQSQANAQPASTSDQSEQDSGRPVLRHGKAGTEQITPTPETAPAAPVANRASTASGAPAATAPSTGSAAAANAAPGLLQIYPAISDAHSAPLRPYTYELRPDERREYEQKLGEIASQELAKYLTQNPGLKPAKTPMRQDGPLYAFDPNWSNAPTFVYSATQASERLGVVYSITVVAHNDIYGELHRLFTSITSTLRLSIAPRLEVIDMVDATGDQRGDLLFRQIWDDHTSYVVYAVGMDKLEQLFQGAEMNARASTASE